MANIAYKIEQIRKAIFGKDVRESIASGIEAINNEVVSTTSRQDAIDANEQIRIINENNRQFQEIDRQSTFNTNENTRQNIFSANELSRELTMAQFKEWFMSTSLSGQLPLMVDGGDFKDPKTGLMVDGGDFR